MLWVHLIEKAGVGHEHTVVGCALYKHPPLVQGGWLDFGRPTGSNQTARLGACVHVS